MDERLFKYKLKIQHIALILFLWSKEGEKDSRGGQKKKSWKVLNYLGSSINIDLTTF